MTSIGGINYPILKAGSISITIGISSCWVNNQSSLSLVHNWGYSILRNGSYIDSSRISFTMGRQGVLSPNYRTWSGTITVLDGDGILPFYSIGGNSSTGSYNCGSTWSVFTLSGGAVLNAVEGIYDGAVSTTSSGTVYKGEWIQVQFPYPLRLQRWVYTPRSGMPSRFLIIASNDGTNWTTLYNQSTALTWTSAAQTFNINNDLHYTHYRFVCVSTTSYSYFNSHQQSLLCSRESIVITNTTLSNSVSTGALQEAGGVGIKGSLYVENLYSGGVRVPTENDLTSYHTKSEITTLLGNKVDTSVLSSYYTRTETDNVLAGKASNFSVQSPLTYANNAIGLDSSSITSLGTLTSLTVSGNVNTEGRASFGGMDRCLGFADQVSRGDSGYSRALVKHSNSTLVLNYGNDFSGGVRCDSPIKVIGTITGNNVVTSEITVKGSSAEGGQINLGYKGNTSITTQDRSSWVIDVDGSNSFRVFTVTSTGSGATSLWTDTSGRVDVNSLYIGNVKAATVNDLSLKQDTVNWANLPALTTTGTFTLNNATVGAGYFGSRLGTVDKVKGNVDCTELYY